MSELIIRKYRRRDRDAVLRITEESFGGFCIDSNMDERFGAIAGIPWQQRKSDGVAYDLRVNPEHTIVAEVDGRVVGYVCNRVYPEYRMGHIANLAVARDMQGQGVGKKLIQASLDHFRQLGLRYARIETLEQNARGRHLYPTFGFQEIGRQIYYMREL